MIAHSTIFIMELLYRCMKEMNENIKSPALGCKVGRAYQMMLSQLAQALKDAGLDLTTSEYLVMRAVFSSPGAQQCEIADMVGKDNAAVCRCVAGLGKKGMVDTETVSYKCLRVYPSARAKELQPRILEVAEKRHNALLDITTPAELDIFNRVLDRIITQNKKGKIL